MDELNLKITNPEKHLQTGGPVRDNLDASHKSKIAKAAKGFESLLTSLMLKSMNKTNEGLFGESGNGGDYFGTIFETEIANKISEGRGLGLAEMIYKKFTGEDLSEGIVPAKMNFNRGKMKESIITSTDGSIKIEPTTTSLKRLNNFETHIDAAAKTYGIDTSLIKSVILTESAGRVDAYSSARAKGLMQLMDGTAVEMGVNDVWNPRENIFGGTKYLAKMIRQYDGDIKKALAAYNAGPTNVEKYNGIPPFEETKNYVTRVLGYLKFFNE